MSEFMEAIPEDVELNDDDELREPDEIEAIEFDGQTYHVKLWQEGTTWSGVVAEKPGAITQAEGKEAVIEQTHRVLRVFKELNS